MQAKVIVRVFCLDGPCPGVNYVDADTGRILFREVASGERRFYRINQQAYTAGQRPDAYFDHVEAAPAAPHVGSLCSRSPHSRTSGLDARLASGLDDPRMRGRAGGGR